MFKINNKETRTTRHSGVFIVNVNFEHISHLVLVFILSTLNMKLPAGFGDNPLAKLKVEKYGFKYLNQFK